MLIQYFLPPCLCFMFVCLIAVGQSPTKYDTTYVKSYDDKILLKVNLDTRTDTYNINENNSLLTVTPNSTLRLFFVFDYEFIGVTFGFSPKFLPGNDDNDLRGKSSFSDVRIRLSFGRWLQEFRYNRIKGYYIRNTGDFTPDWTEGTDPYIQLPNLRNITWGASTSYIVNPKFSLRNILVQTEHQSKSAGSIIPTLYYNYNLFSNSTDNSYNAENNFNVRFALRYYYTWVLHNRWFLSPSLSPSAGIRFTNHKLVAGNTTLVENNFFPTLTIEGGLTAGYSSRKIVFGSRTNFRVSRYNQDKTTVVINDKIYALLYFGYRLNPPKFLKKPVNEIKKVLGR